MTGSLSDAARLSETCKSINAAVNTYCLPKLCIDSISMAGDHFLLKNACANVLESPYFENITLHQLCSFQQSTPPMKVFFLKNLQEEVYSEASSTPMGKEIVEYSSKKAFDLNQLTEISETSRPWIATELNLFFDIVCRTVVFHLEFNESQATEVDEKNPILKADEFQKEANELNVMHKEGININSIHRQLSDDDFGSIQDAITVIHEFALKISSFLKKGEVQAVILKVENMFFSEDFGHPIGAVPREIRYFTNLKNLDISNSSLEFLPPEMTYLKRLEVLEIQNNLFDHVPDVLDQLPELQSLTIHTNPLDEAIVKKELSKPDLADWKREALEEWSEMNK